MSLRLPGDIHGPAQLWRALIAGEDLVTQIDPDRWAVDDLQHPRRAEPGRGITFDAGVLKAIGDFDAAFFGISPREAAMLDPQQRLLLELAWEALEDAGIRPSALAGSDCGVFMGISGLDYGMRVLDDLASITAHTMTGNTMSVAANRISYVFDLHGPSVAVDTACSSSLVALHQACVALRAGDASAALVGGVNLLLHPYPFIGFTKASMLAAQGRCRAFAEGGDGYVRAEGGGMFVLKPLRDAERDGDRILGVIRASGVNADGARKTGLTIPSGTAQAELMARVLARAGLTAGDIDYLEAHGTGTRVGDPIEAGAIGAVYGNNRAGKLPIGSIKSNLGHMEAASGVAGLAKALLVLQNGIVPRTLHAARLNETIDFDGLGLQVARQPIPLAPGAAWRVAVNSFGFGGVNSHVIIERPQPASLPASAPVASPPLVLSAHDEAALRELAGRYLPLLADAAARGAVAHAAWARRDWLPERVAVPDLSGAAMLRGLEDFAAGRDAPALIRERAMPDAPAVAFIYAGNGAQWTGMGRRLLRASPLFTEHVTHIAALIRRHGGPDILDAIASDDPAALEDTAIAQPALFALQVATTMLLRDLGISAGATMGHSVGEIAAAWAAGALDLEMACLVIVARSQAQALTRGTGRMAAIGLGIAAIRAHLENTGLAGAIEIAAENSPKNVTVSGKSEALAALSTGLKGVFYRELNLDYAFHSASMDPIQGQLASSLAALRTAPEQLPFYSSVTGGLLNGAALGGDYWWRNVRDPVRFGPALAAMAADGYRLFIEIGPNAILQRYIAETLDAAGSGGRALGTAPRHEDTLENVRATALRAALLGVPVDAAVYFGAGPAPHAPLPTYPWQRQLHWVNGTAESYRLINRNSCHELLGYRLKEMPASWEVHLDSLKLPALAEHKVGGAAVLPGAAYLEMALAASREWFGTASHIVEDLYILAPVVFDGEHARTLRFIFSPTDLRFRIEGRERLSETPWTVHAQGRLLGAAPAGMAPAIPEPRPGRTTIVAQDHYAVATALGLEYGSLFRGIEAIELDAQVLRASLNWAAGVPVQKNYLLHPAVLDQCFQAVLGWLAAQPDMARDVAFLPVGFGRLVFRADAGPAVELRGRLLKFGARSAAVDFELFDAQGRMIARLDTVRFRAAALAKHVAPPATWITRAQLAPLPGSAPALPADIQGASMAGGQDARALAARTRYFEEIAPLIEMLPLAYARDAGPRQSWRDGHKLQRWLLALAQDEGLIQDGDETVIDDDTIPPAGAIWASVLADCPAVAPELLRIGRVGRLLVATPDADCGSFAATLGAAERDDGNPIYEAARAAALDVLAALLQQWPEGRPVRMLDIGIGEDAMAARLLPMLPAVDGHYVIARSDAEARARLAFGHENGDAEVVALDPTDFSLTPGPYTPAHFDIVLVHHALHEVAQPARALREIRKYLAADGVLLITERHPDRASDFARGIEAGWWHGDARPQGSLLAPQDWTALLREAGWLVPQTVLDAAGSALGLGSFLLIARPQPQRVARQAPAVQRWAVEAGDGGWAELAEATRAALRAHGQLVAGEAAAGCDHWVIFPAAPGMAADAAALARDCETLRVRLLDIARHAPDARVWIITQGGALHDDARLNPPGLGGAAIWGMARSAANELHPLRLTLIDLPDASAGLGARLGRELLENDGESEIVLTRTARYVLRCVPVPAGRRQALAGGETPAWRLDFTLAGQLRNLHWRADTRRELAPDEIEIEARAAGLNFRDVMYAMGLLADEALENGFAGPTLGLEVAGRVRRCGSAVRDFAVGDDVLAFAGASFASHVVVPARAAARMPARWSYAEAATVPTVFFTVWYALAHLAQLRPGERILIHGAAGGVGLAAIQVARHLGAEIFASAGSDAKRDFVTLLGADHVIDSRSPHFDQAVLDLTGGAGVDVVLNSLSGEAIARNLRALKPFGRFIELGKRDFYENTAIGLRPFRNNISYFGVDADQLMLARPELASLVFREVMALFAEGQLSPLPHRVFAADEVVDAFRHMQQARQIGKVVVDLTVPPRHVRPAGGAPKMRLNPDATYLVTGGLSGFGRATVDWLVERGARHLALVSRSGLAATGATLQLAALRAQGVNARAFACDVADRAALTSLLDEIAHAMPALRGVVHAAMVLDDALLANLDEARFARVLAPKLDGAWNLHALTRDLPLDLFLLFSSATTMLGNPGQANYVAANAALEALALLRRREGLAACAVCWGPIADVGVLTGNLAARDALRARLGANALDSRRALAQLDQVLAQGHGVVAVMDLDWPTLQRMLPAAHEKRFDLLRQRFGSAPDAAGDEDLRLRLQAMPEADARLLLTRILTEEIAEILRLPAERIGHAQSVFELGMDSLMAVELALALEKRFGVTVPPMLINENPSVERIAERLLASLAGERGEGDATHEMVAALASHHAETEILADIGTLVEQVREAAASGARLVA